MVWLDVKNNPASGTPLSGLNNDVGFHHSDGWQKMSKEHTLPNGKVIVIHYQYNPKTGDLADMKFDSKFFDEI